MRRRRTKNLTMPDDYYVWKDCHLGVRKDTGKDGWVYARQYSPTY